jgi:CubicO group peptidase (beta-lactamase class C family)
VTAAALAAITAYAEQHRLYMALPALTLGLALPNGGGVVRHFGAAELGARTPVTDATLFQIGSISKLMTAALVHQLAAEGKVALGNAVASYLPEIPLPSRSGITVQQLLDHVSGLPADAPLFPPGGLWTGFEPGRRWSYSNTGYDILGKLIEKADGRPLARALQDRLFVPLGMRSSYGAITADQRARYAQGYEAADNIAPFVRGATLAPASWVDVTFAAGSVASTAGDMVLLMRSLAAAARGQGGLGLQPAAGQAFARHAIATDNPAMRYGNGLMHVTSGGRPMLHHTGGMVSFSSAFHLDPASGVGAFASTSLTGLAGYRPRLLTAFAVEALAAAAAGRPLPRPPALGARVDAAKYAGAYAGSAGAFEIRAGAAGGLAIVADGREAALEAIGGEVFRTLHPRFRAFSLLFEKPGDNAAVAGASWGGDSFARAGATWAPGPSDPALAKLAGRYVDDSPWFGGAHVIERGGKLWIGTETPLAKIGDNLWRVGSEDWSPERVAFADLIAGRPQTLYFSGEKFVRHDV